MQISLSLSGGAARGVYHLGVLHGLDEMHIEIKALCGVSIGAIIAASYASGVKPKRQLEIFKSQEFKNAFSFNWFRGSLFDVDYHADVFKKLIPKEKIEELPIPLWISVFDITHAKSFIFNKGDLKEICLASGALTPVFKPVLHDDVFFADGGFANNLVVEPLTNLPYKIVGVNLHPIERDYHQDGFLSIAKRIAFLSAFSAVTQSENMCDIVIASPKLRDYSLFSLSEADALFALGYEDAKRVFASQDLGRL
ncbi:MAG: patatin-like phospholipase family protein [Sulfurovaceae bacterium]|jgi:NTE family protein